MAEPADPTPSVHHAFWAALGELPPEPEQRQVEAALDRALESSRARWPQLNVDAAAFLAHWGRKAEGPLLETLPQTHATDLYLAFACASGSGPALAILEKDWVARILPGLRRIDPRPVFLDELRQQLLERVLLTREGRPPRIAEYSGQAPLEHWLRAVAFRLGLNQRRDLLRAPEEPASDDLLGLAAPLRDPELDLLKARLGPSFSSALREALDGLSARERSLLRLHYVEGLSLSQVGAVYQVNKSTVSRWLEGTRQTLHGQLRAALERSGVPAPELESVLRVMTSRIDLNLASVLRSRA